MRGDLRQEYVDYVSARLPVLHRTAYLLCGDGHLADDLVQATTTALYQHWRRARAAERVDAYVHRILVRKFLDHRRSGWARVRLLSWLPERAAPAAPIAEHDDLHAALRKLPHTQRAVLVLRFLVDLPVDEVAEILRCSPSAVTSHTNRGLTALRRVLGVTATTTDKEGR